MGAERARKAAEELLAAGARALVSWGSAGALVEALRPGSLLLPIRIVSAEGANYFVDPEWHGALLRRLTGQMPVSIGTLVESPGMLADTREKRAWGRLHDASAVDMESASVARVAAERQVPFVAIRAIADPVGLGLPDYLSSTVNPTGGIRYMGMAIEASRHPGDWLQLFRIGRAFGAARRSMREAATCLGAGWPLPARKTL